MLSRATHIIRSIFYNSKINKEKFIVNKKKINRVIHGVKYKQQNLSFMKRRIHTTNKKGETPLFTILGASFGGGRGGGGGNNIVPILCLIAAYSIHKFGDKKNHYF
jgi:hypothetical protein